MPNALGQATSPYLLQHADNPVDWYPWGPEALDLARSSGRPILLSIGYSACHWCHVMAHESFEHEPTAALMNAHFVNIKVDREERPDLDRIYQLAHQMLTRRPGGWPLTMFLTHDDHLPFFGGTYFPREPRHRLPAFGDLLRGVAQAYTQRPAEIRNQNEQLRAALDSFYAPEPAVTGALDAAPAQAAVAELRRQYDPHDGGYTGAPKFPHVTFIERLLRHALCESPADPMARDDLASALHTLRAMAEGGLFDQVGGGFARYSVDERWEIPHFEKMLYDNGPLLGVYAEAAQIARSLTDDDPLKRPELDYAAIAARTLDWLQRELQDPAGGFYSSLDADSEGVEGKFYVWTPREVASLLPDEDFALFAARYGLNRPPNFEGHFWHLRVAMPIEELARRFNYPRAEVETRLQRALDTLREVRARRIWPGRDDKILTAWNALIIRGLASTARCLPELASTAIPAAERCVDFLRNTLWVNQRLLATCKDGRAALPAYLDDYAFLLDGLLSLFVVSQRRADLEFAVALAEALLSHFEDQEQGGFFFTAHDHEVLIQRPKTFADEALPSGNALAARGLLRLGHWLGEPRYLEAAERTLRAAFPAIERSPISHCSLLQVLHDFLEPPTLVVLSGPDPVALVAWRAAVIADYRPSLDCLVLPNADPHWPSGLQRYPNTDVATAWVCRGTQCSAPLTGLAELLAAIA